MSEIRWYLWVIPVVPLEYEAPVWWLFCRGHPPTATAVLAVDRLIVWQWLTQAKIRLAHSSPTQDDLSTGLFNSPWPSTSVVSNDPALPLPS